MYSIRYNFYNIELLEKINISYEFYIRVLTKPYLYYRDLAIYLCEQ